MDSKEIIYINNRPSDLELRYTSSSLAVNGLPLAEVISNLQQLAEGFANPVVYISEMGDQIEVQNKK